jgi:hypothetical protein
MPIGHKVSFISILLGKSQRRSTGINSDPMTTLAVPLLEIQGALIAPVSVQLEHRFQLNWHAERQGRKANGRARVHTDPLLLMIVALQFRYVQPVGRAADIARIPESLADRAGPDGQGVALSLAGKAPACPLETICSFDFGGRMSAVAETGQSRFAEEAHRST